MAVSGFAPSRVRSILNTLCVSAVIEPSAQAKPHPQAHVFELPAGPGTAKETTRGDPPNGRTRTVCPAPILKNSVSPRYQMVYCPDMAWTLRLPADLEERLQSFCLSQGAVKQRVVTLALEAYLDSQDLAAKTWEQIRSEPVFPGQPPFLEADVTLPDEKVFPVPEKPRDVAFPVKEKRTEPCIHRVSQDDFCSYCDVWIRGLPTGPTVT